MNINESERQSQMLPLLSYLEQLYPLSKEFIKHYEKDCSHFTIKKNKFILSPADTNNSTFFLLKGVVRGFIKDDKKDISTWFGFEHQFIEAAQNPKEKLNYATEYIQAIEDCELIRIPNKLTNFLYAAYPEAGIIARKLFAVQYYAASERSILARIPTALGRYLRLAQSGMNISRIPQRYLASYLGIRLETLSRIKNRSMEQDALKIA